MHAELQAQSLALHCALGAASSKHANDAKGALALQACGPPPCNSISEFSSPGELLQRVVLVIFMAAARFVYYEHWRFFGCCATSLSR